ncbi:MAG TPA: cyclic nucleotide-binding domain-containing protein [Actinomycetota bacterium]|nr:cyclic nucleotide-binding domain-containing protein [Actinomycetota bacterium]
MSQPQPYVPARRPRPTGAANLPEQRARRTRRETVVALSGVPLFADLPRRQIQRVAKEADELTFGAGETIVQEGMLGETMFVILEGQAKVVRGKRKVGEVLPGEFFGELSLIDGGPRSASVVADTPMRVLRIFRRTLTGLWRDDPKLAIRVLDGLVKRVREVARQTNG